jgi:cyclopropane-fatty-acyl-phospholipid synthase
VSRYVFPDSGLVPISTMLRAAEEAGWEVRDVESLREHYMLTLRQWVRRLEQQADRARELVGDVAYRIWRLYMAGSAHRFQTGWLNLYQSLLVKGEGRESELPLRRADWYRKAISD